TPPVHWIVPPMQCSTPCTHVPVPLPQRAPPPGSPSSATPLQLSSMLLHVSCAGSLLHASASVVRSPGVVGLHSNTAPLHAPMPLPHAAPAIATAPSAITQLQSGTLPPPTPGPAAVQLQPSPALPSLPPPLRSPFPPSPVP